jgi:serine-type D-Ala-D-Ala carboxypeptidase (penicillin-binding protein 5/6)
VRAKLALIVALCAGPMLVATMIGTVAVGSTLARNPSPPPPTPAGPSGEPSPFPTALHTPKPGAEPPAIKADAAVLEDLDTGQVLYRKQPSKRRPIASLTKVMTALLVLERAGPHDPVTVSDRAASQTGSVLGLEEGERISVQHLLYGLLLQSSNDAAVALAEHVGGTVERFVKMMNERAAALGLEDTVFRSPNGLDDRGHSTALDMAELTRDAYADATFASIVRTRFHSIPAPSGPARRIQNRNALLWLYPGAEGVKTGFTTPAGHCLIAAAERDGLQLVAVVLDEPTDTFSDGAALLDYGFTAFAEATLVRTGEDVGPVDVRGRPVSALAGRGLVALVRQRDLTDIRRRVVPTPGLRAPIRAGQTVGLVRFTVGSRLVGEVPAVAARALGPPAFWEFPPEDLTPAGRNAQALAILVRSLAASFL